MLRLAFLIILLVSAGVAQPRLDSLLTSLKGEEPSAQINTLLDLCWNYRSITPDQAIDYGIVALQKMDGNELYDDQSKAYNFLGVIYGNLGMLDSAYHYYDLALTVADERGDDLQIAYSLNNLGDYYFKNALYSLALEKIFEANKIFEQLGDQKGVAYTLNDIGEIYVKQKDLEKALDYFLRSGGIRESLGDTRGVAKSRINEAGVYAEQKLYDKSLETYKEALAYSREAGYVKGESWIFSGMGRVYFDTGEYRKAMEAASKALEIDKKIGNKYGEIINYNELGLILIELGELQQAGEMFTLARSESEQTGHLDQLMASFNNLRKFALINGNYERAYESLSQYEALKDTIYGLEAQNHINDLQTAYVTEKQKRENEILKRDVEVAETARNYIFVIVLIIALAGYIIWRRYRSEKRVNDELQQLNMQKDKLLSIIGHDLKNPAGAVNNYLEILVTDWDELSSEDLREFSHSAFKASTNLNHLLLELLEWGMLTRGQISLAPERFSLLEVTTSVIGLLKPQAEKKKIKLIYTNCDKKLVTDRNMLTTVLRNLTANAVKFTPQEGQVVMNCSLENGEHRISVKDTGVGIAPEKIPMLFSIDSSTSTKGTAGEVGTGLGLPICKEFVERCGGKLEVESQHGKGSTFTVILPDK